MRTNVLLGLRPADITEDIGSMMKQKTIPYLISQAILDRILITDGASDGAKECNSVTHMESNLVNRSPIEMHHRSLLGKHLKQ